MNKKKNRIKTYIVTGGAGFIGSSLTKRLLQRGDRVYVLDNLSTGFERHIPADAIFYHIDITDMDKLLAIEFTQEIDAIFHFAAQPSGEASFDDPLRDIEVNYIATYNVLKLCEELRCFRFIYASSMSVYGDINQDNPIVSESYVCNPISYYGCNKLASEKMINLYSRHSGISFTNFRLFNVYGPGQNMCNMKQGMLSIYLSYIMKDLPIVVKGSLDRFRDFIYIEDVINAVLACEMLPKTFNQTYNLGTGVKTMVYDLLRAILQSYGKDDFDSWVIVEGNTPGDIKGIIADMTKWRMTASWNPEFKLQDGLRNMKKWIDETKEWWKY